MFYWAEFLEFLSSLCPIVLLWIYTDEKVHIIKYFQQPKDWTKKQKIKNK